LLIFGPLASTLFPYTTLFRSGMGSRAEYVKIASNGSNALDFHIAFYIGQLATKEPESYFHIVSKDTGFDPLIQHLKGKKIQVSRDRKSTRLNSSHVKISYAVF